MDQLKELVHNIKCMISEGATVYLFPQLVINFFVRFMVKIHLYLDEISI